MIVNIKLQEGIMDRYFYECGGVKLNAFYSESYDGLVLGGGEGALKELYIPKMIDGIVVKAVAGEFLECLHGFDRVIIDEDNEYFSVADGILFNKDKTEVICYPPGRTDESYCVPEGVKMICDCSLGNENLRKIVLPAGLEEIEQYAVTGCKNLEEITIPKSLKRVFMKAFMWCENLKEVYYEGCAEEWSKIDFTMFNDYLTNAHINYNCKIEKENG